MELSDGRGGGATGDNDYSRNVNERLNSYSFNLGAGSDSRGKFSLHQFTYA